MSGIQHLVDWKAICVHNETEIKGFFGPYRFLSNFWIKPVIYNGVLYPSSEHAYQAQKVIPKYAYLFVDPKLTPVRAKRLSKKYTDPATLEHWTNINYTVMYQIVLAKFTQNVDLTKLLIETGDRYLEETNWWKDIIWGYDINLKRGKNQLGEILMLVRDKLIKQQTST